MSVFLLVSVSGNSQNLVDYKADDITKYMKGNRSDMNKEKVNNKSFRYLKYSDKNDSQTMLFFLDADSVCRNIRIVCNNNIREAKIRELDSSFSKNGKYRWIDNRSGKNYYIRLDDDEWSFTITIEPVK
ncbi:MAG: hypothetical protein A2X03_03600 [Bacteroidetes bacterium GWA2_40_15]|nr:MAG: hypothetical protein A2X03_03600 [Bacteroidetes bacterium GWA2_40_15]HAM10485.1 hypothetical protein [Bacteroidales bacterium]HBH82361.1 hypothetical protein [Bacteroidales bacterium]